MDDDNEKSGKSRTRTKLITRAQERVHDIRGSYTDVSQLGLGDEIEGATLFDLQSAVMEYYYALRPLRDEPAVKDFWNDAEIWEEKTGEYIYYDSDDHPHEVYKKTDDGKPKVLKRLDDEDANPRRIDKFDELWREPEYEPVTGFDSLEDATEQYEEFSQTVADSFGERSVPEVRRVPIDGKKLVSASKALDDAASKLGFAPESAIPVEMDPEPI